MGEIEKANLLNEVDVVSTESDLMELTEDLLFDARLAISSQNALSVPISELATLGAGVASLVPALNTVTQTTSFATDGLYRLANTGVGDVLKVAKNGNFWGAFKNAEGNSKFLQIKSAGPMSASSTATAISPVTMMMAVALYSIEKELANIAETSRQILSFLEIEKESEIEADVETLMNIVSKYKLNWDNTHFVSSNHKLVLDIQRTARKNMSSYQKQVTEIVKSKQFIVAQSKVNSTLLDLVKKFKYYRLSLYTFSLASLMEIMLSGNFKQEYISSIKYEIKQMSQIYRNLFGDCSVLLEKMSTSALETNVVKGIAIAGKAVGSFIGSIPHVKESKVDEFLIEKGTNLESAANKVEKKTIAAFAEIGNPGTGMFVDKMEDMVKIYNHTTQICFDKERIYLLAS